MSDERKAWFYGETEDGRYNILIPENPISPLSYTSPCNIVVWVNGKRDAINSVFAYRDGGTIVINGAFGTYKFPAPRKRMQYGQRNTFNDIPID